VGAGGGGGVGGLGRGGGVEKEGVQLVKGWVEEVRIRKGLFVQGRKLVLRQRSGVRVGGRGMECLRPSS